MFIPIKTAAGRRSIFINLFHHFRCASSKTKSGKTYWKIKAHVPNTVADVLKYKELYPFHTMLKKSEDQARRKRVVIDFSSPNIAKPFHAGHLRSTVLGNFLANLLSHSGCDVVRLNYYGDWGTQFSLILAGLERLGKTVEDGERATDIDEILKVYVEANALQQRDEEFADRVREISMELEKGDDAGLLEKWRVLRRISLDHFHRLYGRMGIEFDEEEFESSFARSAVMTAKEMVIDGSGNIYE